MTVLVWIPTTYGMSAILQCRVDILVPVGVDVAIGNSQHLEVQPKCADVGDGSIPNMPSMVNLSTNGYVTDPLHENMYSDLCSFRGMRTEGTHLNHRAGLRLYIARAYKILQLAQELVRT